uniref:Uncharacterized protein n=1 Tax=Tetranychus urticae TaxID=32264 RepID=T1KYE5_TETUR
MSSKDKNDDKEPKNRRHTINLPTKTKEDEPNSKDKKVERSASVEVYFPTSNENHPKQAHKIWDILTVPDEKEEDKILAKIKKITQDKLQKDLVKKASQQNLNSIEAEADPLNDCFVLDLNQNLHLNENSEDNTNFADVEHKADKVKEDEPLKHKMESKTASMRAKLLKGKGGKSPDSKKPK